MVVRSRQSNNTVGQALENRDPRIEQLLNRYKVGFNYIRDVSVAQIDIDRSRTNQARFESLNKQTVETYTQAVHDGDVFPPIVAYRASRGKAKKLTVVDGNHRVASHQAAQRPLDVYELDSATPPDTIAMLTYVCNTQNGLSYTQSERMDHAATMVEVHQITVPHAAALMNIREGQLRTALTKRAANRRAADAKIDPPLWDSLPQHAKSRLNAITTDEMFKMAAKLVYDARLTAPEVNTLVTELGEMKSMAKQKAFIEQQKEAYEDRISATLNGKVAKKGPQTHKHRLSLAMSHLAPLPNNAAEVAKFYVGDDRDAMAEQVEEAIAKFQDLLEALRA